MLPDNYKILLESYQEQAARPYLQPLVVPKTSRSFYWSGFLMNGVIPYNMCMVPYFEAPSTPWSRQQPLVAPVVPYGTNNIYSGQANKSGIYTGVK